MNVDKINKLARFLRRMQVRNPGAFNMGEWGNDWLLDGDMLEQHYDDDQAGMLECTSPMCVAGWAVYLDKTAWESFLGGNDVISNWARESLGLGVIRGQMLFIPAADDMPDGLYAYQATPIQAARVLEHLALTGEVDWAAMVEASDGEAN